MSSSVEGIRRANDAHAQHAPGHRNKLPTVAGAANRLVCGVLIASMTAPFCFVPVQGHMINVSGSGTAHMAGPIWHLMDDLKNQAKQDIEMTYRAVDTATGIAEFLGDVASSQQPYNTFGSGDEPISTAQYNALVGNGGAMVHIPVAAGAINAFHSLPELDLSNHSLNITNCALAGIFAGTLTEWSDPEIAAHNPNLSASIQDKLIRVAVDSGASIATSLFTRYMSSCSSWDGLQTGSSIEWPSHVHKVEGSAGMTAFLRQNAYAIGYLHIHHGHAQGLTEVNLQIGNGSFIDTSAPGPIGNALDYAVDNGVFPAAGDNWDGVHHNLVDVPAPNAWPLTHLQYVYVRADLVSLGNVGTTMTALLRFMLSSRGQTVFGAHGFIEFTDKMKTTALATVDSINVSTTATEWTFEQDAAEVFTGAGEFVFSDFRRNWDANLMEEYNEVNGTLTDVQARLAMMQMHHDDFSNQITEHDDAIDNLTTTHTRSLEELSTLLTALQAEYTSMLGMLNTHHSLLDGLHGSNDTFTTLRSDLQTMHDSFYVSELRLKEQMSKVAGVEAQVLQQNQESDSRVEQLAIGGIVLAVISILFNILMVTVYYKNEFSQVSNVKYRTYAESEL